MIMRMKIILILLAVFVTAIFAQSKINVVTTLSTYADLVQKIGGDRVSVRYIVAGDQDAHFVRPKPSFAVLINKADMFVTTGLDLELWVPSLVDMSKNDRIRSGQPGFVAAYDGIELLDKPSVLSRSEGGLHIYGNPHITMSPLNLKVIAENITIGLEKQDPQNSKLFRKNLADFKKQIDENLFGAKLVKLMGGDLMTKLAQSGKLIDFLSNKKFKGKKLISFLGGWLKAGIPFRGKKVVAYHKNWVYFHALFGIDVVGYVEPKPGIPPSPKHVEDLVQEMKKQNVKVIMAANYFDEKKVKTISERVGAKAVILPIYVNGIPEVKDVFSLTNYWITKLRDAFLSIN